MGVRGSTKPIFPIFIDTKVFSPNFYTKPYKMTDIIGKKSAVGTKVQIFGMGAVKSYVPISTICKREMEHLNYNCCAKFYFDNVRVSDSRYVNCKVIEL